MGSSVILPPPGQPVQGPDPNFKQGGTKAVVSFDLVGVAPPSLQYIQRDDVLTLEVTSSVVETVFFTMRLLLAPVPLGGQPDRGAPAAAVDDPRASNRVQIIQQQMSVSAGQVNVLQQLSFALAEGYLLSVECVALNALQRGQTFVRALLMRPPGVIPSANITQSLFSDYVTEFGPIGWPYGRNIYPSESTGALLDTNTANPAAGADFVVNVPQNQRWRWQSTSAVLTTSAAVGNRQVHVRVTDGSANIVFDAPALAVQAASLVVRYTFAPGLTSITTTDGSQLLPLPSNLVGGSGFGIRTATTAIQAGDQWSAIFSAYEQLMESV